MTADCYFGPVGCCALCCCFILLKQWVTEHTVSQFKFVPPYKSFDIFLASIYLVRKKYNNLVFHFNLNDEITHVCAQPAEVWKGGGDTT
jgi:hypothetical protein